MRLNFVKMHGLGNDFIVFDASGLLPDAAALRRLADRHTGIGFDQALAIEAPRRPGTEAFYRIFNADGREVEQCGNGARCIAAFILHRKGRRAGELSLDSAGGRVEARVHEDGLVAVQMGVPSFDPSALPFTAAAEADRYTLDANGRGLIIGAVSVGNPHAVMQVPSIEDAPVDSIGPAVENHPRFPQRTNVEFMQILTPAHIRLRVHERGVGETRACGTGACGAVAVGRRWNLLDERVQVDLPGGTLSIEWRGPGAPIWLTGPATFVFEGHVELT